MSRQDWYQFAFAATTTGKFVFPLCLNLGWRRNQHGVVSSLCLNMACIFPKGERLQFNLNQFRWLKDLQLFQFVLHCPPTSDFLPPCLNTFQIHIKKVIYGTYLYTSLHIPKESISQTHPPVLRFIAAFGWVLEAEVCQQRHWWLGFWQPKWRGFDCEMVVAWVVGDDLRLVIDVSCIAQRLAFLAQQNQNMRGLPKKPKIGMVDSSSSKGLLFNPLILR